MIAIVVQRLRELGWIDGYTIAIQFRWAEGRTEQMAEIAAEFVRLKVDVIVTTGTPATLAAKQATSVIPIVFVVGFDPVTAGLVASLSRPGGNITGMTLFSDPLAQKRLEILLDIVPGASVIAMLVNPVSPDSAPEIKAVQEMTNQRRVQLQMLSATSLNEIEDRKSTRLNSSHRSLSRMPSSA